MKALDKRAELCLQSSPRSAAIEYAHFMTHEASKTRDGRVISGEATQSCHMT